jgi:hypothetical protein
MERRRRRQAGLIKFRYGFLSSGDNKADFIFLQGWFYFFQDFTGNYYFQCSKNKLVFDSYIMIIVIF